MDQCLGKTDLSFSVLSVNLLGAVTATLPVAFGFHRCGKQEMEGELHLKQANSSTLTQTLDGTV